MVESARSSDDCLTNTNIQNFGSGSRPCCAVVWLLSHYQMYVNFLENLCFL
jgi:hypothetical protein